jgi:hypothetical protein
MSWGMSGVDFVSFVTFETNKAKEMLHHQAIERDCWVLSDQYMLQLLKAKWLEE